MTEPRPILRLDKWLWQARFVKSRALAAKLVEGAGVRVNSNRIAKPAYNVGAGDVLTFALGERVVVLRILALGTRRGPAPEARGLYEDLSPPPPSKDLSRPVPVAGGRPDKRARRRFDAGQTDALD
ncbi:RNA-binding S4 domain-containing protein [Roseinatronobacter bogoriensis]|uniref:RNA-binding S4 domain-containing protein n=1 Tax=Roseinatronobacter bogoriensis subsp. barguzinensis TaxID=441209 RepID=A0A2K8K8Y4_9RHOB|nr:MULTISPECIES: RNA-binding S4 domain-containing protein [Rhodobaca]ATX65911.1 RNA-binding S4 domain-containing protein [Rhodobaca barguzinensis]MBB4208114.1 ribosome-associated heat shock protein Hsp15 [Rhodobaca bogoriensis DSM 18756]TDW38754.1 heat shock protein Hsp15 [Rhodobaca barguzinensis]TDY69208.1 heat shock protein Hsp15 [Rhodobaca bogoriensis DSM 18756]